MPFAALLECLQKTDQRCLVFIGERQSKLVTPNRPCLHTITDKSGRYIVIAQAPRIEPVFQGSDAAVVLKWAPVPHTPKGGHFVITSSAARCDGQPTVRANSNWKDIGP